MVGSSTDILVSRGPLTTRLAAESGQDFRLFALELAADALDPRRLALTLEMVTQQGGQLDVNSEIDKGSTFSYVIRQHVLLRLLNG